MIIAKLQTILVSVPEPIGLQDQSPTTKVANASVLALACSQHGFPAMTVMYRPIEGSYWALFANVDRANAGAVYIYNTLKRWEGKE